MGIVYSLIDAGDVGGGVGGGVDGCGAGRLVLRWEGRGHGGVGVGVGVQ